MKTGRSFTLDLGLLSRLDAYCRLKGASYSAVAEAAIREYLNSNTGTQAAEPQRPAGEVIKCHNPTCPAFYSTKLAKCPKCGEVTPGMSPAQELEAIDSELKELEGDE